jgi:hypothetical protein
LGTKFQKPQNENVCLTNLNKANNGNFPILSSEVCIALGKKAIKMRLLTMEIKVWFYKSLWSKLTEKLMPYVAFCNNFNEIIV